MKNKRGQELSTNVIILIILGVIVLVVLTIGFYFGWDTLKGWFLGGGAVNLDKVIQSCEIACISHSTYDFCNKKRDLKTEDTNWKNVTCNYLATRQTQFEVRTCSEIPCSNIEFVDVPSGTDVTVVATQQTFEKKKCDTIKGKTIQFLGTKDKDRFLYSKDCLQ
jgi:hypothetical protein